jgi:pantoate--beta-alanine ligase
VSLPVVLRNAAAIERWRRKAKGSLGFVPTMGALHAGHLSLVQRARRENARVLVSIFVNPTQFGPKEDFKRYPRDLRGDRGLLAAVPGTAVYAPSVEEIYPSGFATTVKVGGALGERLEAEWRPGHFEGVATVVARLFALAKPGTAYFGLKDYQQFLVLRRMALDLGLPIKLQGCATIREADGLALSSRNRYLDPRQRELARSISAALRQVRAAAAQGESSVRRLEALGRRTLKKTPGLKIQYFAVADAESLEPLRRLDGQAQALTACLLGQTRLIDNMRLGNA